MIHNGGYHNYKTPIEWQQVCESLERGYMITIVKFSILVFDIISSFNIDGPYNSKHMKLTLGTS